MKPFIRLTGVCLAIAFTVVCSNTFAQTYNLITSGTMEGSSGWAGVPGATNLSTAYEASTGLDGTRSLKTVTTNMGGDSYYILRCDDVHNLTNATKITISFWAKASVANMRLQPWVQESGGNQWMNFGDAYLTTGWKKYQFTATISTPTSSLYKLKFRGYNTGTMYIDNVEIGPVDYENVAQSGIYDVSLSQSGKSWPLNVFRNTCPTYQLGFQNMEAKDQHPLNLFANRTINWTKFSFSGSITVKVTVNDIAKVPVSGQTVRILPSRYGVTSTTSGNTVTFTITQPGQYSVEIGTEYYKNCLFIFADPVETTIPSKTDPNYLVLYEATASNMSSIPTNYSGVYFRRGVHNIGQTSLPSHIKNVYFEDGSWVYGTMQINNSSNVKLFGRGVLSSAKMNYRQAHCLEAINGSNNVTVEGLVVADAKYFGIRLIGTDNIVNYAKVLGGWVYNCDGIAAFERSNVSKCFIWANDDAIKAYRDSATFSEIVVWQLNNGGIIQMSWGGAIGGSTAKNVKISKLDVLRAEWDVARFNVGLLNCVGNRYQEAGRYALQQDWLIEDVVTQRPIPLIFNITPDIYTHNHISGLTMKNWNVKMTMGTSFINEIKGEDPNNYLSGFVFDNVKFNDVLLTNINYISTGDMNNGGWVAVPKTTDQVVGINSTYGMNGNGLRSVVTTMGGGSDYVIKANELFSLTNNQKVTVNFYAKATAAGKRLVPFVQETVNNNWMNIGDFNLTTDWKLYTATVNLSTISSNNYQIKFRGYETAWMFLDKVQVGPPDWRTVLEAQTKYLNTPLFLPNSASRRMPQSAPLEEVYRIFPNPVRNVLLLKGGDNNMGYKVYDQLGSLHIIGKGREISVTRLGAGMYIIALDNGQRMSFIKQ